MLRQRKWHEVSELAEIISRDALLDSCSKCLKCLCYAPNVGYRAWIFKYKHTLVSLWDIGNGHYSFHSTVTWFDLLMAKIQALVDRIRR